MNPKEMKFFVPLCLSGKFRLSVAHPKHRTNTPIPTPMTT